MPSFSTFLSNSAAKIRAVSPGQGLSGNQIGYWRDGFNTLVQNMSADRLFLFFVPDVAYVLANAKESFQIGPGAADFDTLTTPNIRPVFIESARAKVGAARRWPMRILTEQEWAVNPRRGVTDPDGPTDIYFGAAVKVSTFNVAPLPNAGQTIYVSQWNPLKTFDLTEMALNMEDFYPPEYVLALELNLAIQRAPAYGLAVSQELAANAQMALQTIRSLNNTRLSGAQGESATLRAPAIGIGTPVGGPQ